MPLVRSPAQPLRRAGRSRPRSRRRSGAIAWAWPIPASPASDLVHLVRSSTHPREPVAAERALGAHSSSSTGSTRHRGASSASWGSAPSSTIMGEQLQLDLRLGVGAHRAEDQLGTRRRAAPSPGSACASGASTGRARSPGRRRSEKDEPAVVEVDAPLGNTHARAERQEVRLDEADEEAVGVGEAEVRGAAVLGGCPGAACFARSEVDRRPGAEAIQSSSRRSAARHRHRARIGDVGVAVGAARASSPRASGGRGRTLGRERRSRRRCAGPRAR